MTDSRKRNKERVNCFTDTIPRSGAERNEGKRMSPNELLVFKSFRFEDERIRKDLFVAMKWVDVHRYGWAGWNFVSIQHNIFAYVSFDVGYARVESQRLFDATL